MNKQEAIDFSTTLTTSLCNPEQKEDALKIIITMIAVADVQGDNKMVALLSSLYTLLASHDLSLENVLAKKDATEKLAEEQINYIQQEIVAHKRRQASSSPLN